MGGSRWIWTIVAVVGLAAAQFGFRPALANKEVGPSNGWVLKTWGTQNAKDAQLFFDNRQFLFSYNVHDQSENDTNPASSIVTRITFPSHVNFGGHPSLPGNKVEVQGNTIIHTVTSSAGGTGADFDFTFKPSAEAPKPVTFQIEVQIDAKRDVRFGTSDTYGAATIRYNGFTDPTDKETVHPGDHVHVEFTLTPTVSTGDPVIVKKVSFGAGSAGKLVPGSVSPPARTQTETGGIWEIPGGGPTTFKFDAVVRSPNEIPEETTALFLGSGAIFEIRREETNRGGKRVTTIYEGAADPFRVFIPLDKNPLKLEWTAQTLKPGEAKEDEIVSYTLKASSNTRMTELSLSNILPPDTQLVRGSVLPPAQNQNCTLNWDFENVTEATVKFKLKIKEQKPEVLFITNRARADAVQEGGGEVSAELNNTLRFLHAEIVFSASDANSRYLDGLFLPDAANAVKVLDLDWDHTRAVVGAATDGVTLLLLRAKIKANKHGKVRFVVEDDDDGRDTGSVWPLNATALIDNSKTGGARDSMPAGVRTLVLDAQRRKGDKEFEYAFALYRSPRDFDGPNTADQQNRPLKLKVELLAPDNTTVQGQSEFEMKLVRPLVLLQHGTFDTPDGWALSPMWTESGNALNGYQGWSADFPFQTDRPSFGNLLGGAGPLQPNATAARQSANVILDQWREQTQCTGAQVDVICHSQGGVVWRWIAQTQLDSPVTLQQQGPNFRHAGNWGHGLLHKLITMATTHRGSAVSNHSAYMNHFGKIPGLIRRVSEWMKAPIDLGGVEDQMVVAPLLLEIRETRVPGHALVGSGLPEFNFEYAKRLSAFWAADLDAGPFHSVGPLADITGVRWDVYRKIANYGFNLNYTRLQDDLFQDPNYDLTVSSYSSKGRMPKTATSDHGMIEAQSQLPLGSLVGRLTHGDQIYPGAGDPVPVRAVANRMAFLLRQPTKSNLFAFFPAVAKDPLTPTERNFSDPAKFNVQWLYEKTVIENTRRLAAQPTLSTDPNGPDIAVGEDVHVNVAWTGKTIKQVLLVYPGHAGSSGTVILPEGESSHVFVVPSRPPGVFPVGAIVTATDGDVSLAEARLEIAAPNAYSALKTVPSRLNIRDTTPSGVEVYGRNTENAWEEVTQSRHLTIQSGNANVIAVEENGALTPNGFGDTTLTIRYKGLSASLPVSVTGESVPAVVAPKKKGKIKAASQKAVEWVFLSAPGFNALNIDPKSIRIKDVIPESIRQKDYNKDRVPDLAALVAPKSLLLAPGTVRVAMLAALAKGGLVKGEAVATVK